MTSGTKIEKAVKNEKPVENEGKFGFNPL